MSTTTSITVEELGSTRVITLDRPSSRNAISIAMMQELAAAFARCADDPDARAIVLTGGRSCFSAGRDLKEAARQTPEDAETARQAWTSLAEAIETHPLPVIAAIEGWCLTGGLELALLCDLRIAGSGASFGITSARLGSIAGFGGTQRLPRLIGQARALELMFWADPIDTETASQFGLINRVTPAGTALEEALVLADHYATRAPLSLAAIKRAVREGSEMPISEGLALELALGRKLAQSEDRREGMAAFLEKRKPVFRKR